MTRDGSVLFYPSDNYQAKENISKDIINIQRESYCKRIFNGKLGKEVEEYIVDVYDRLKNYKNNHNLKDYKSSIFNVELFERTLYWICSCGPNEKVKEHRNYDIEELYNFYGSEDTDFIRVLIDELVFSKVDILYLAQIVLVFDNIEVLTHKGTFGIPNTKNVALYSDENYIEEYLKYSSFYNNKVTIFDFKAFINYFFDFPEQLTSLFIKSSSTGLGFNEIIMDKSKDEEEIIYHYEDEDPSWYYEHNGECVEERFYTYYNNEIIDDYFSFGYIMRNPFNIYDILKKSIPAFDLDGRINSWLKDSFKKEFGYDYYEHQQRQLAAMETALKGNSFYDAIVEANSENISEENFFKKGIFSLEFHSRMTLNSDEKTLSFDEETPF